MSDFAQKGANGSAGTNGSGPGVAGTAGGAGAAGDISNPGNGVDTTNTAEGTGGNGGVGGAGGSGAGTGGAAGAGGAAGQAQAGVAFSLTSTTALYGKATAAGGAGAAAGKPGNVGTAYSGAGAAGGAGGAATASATATNPSTVSSAKTKAIANGGAGGAAYGPGGAGGTGGVASGVTASAYGRTAFAAAYQTGGAGGAGYDGASGGAGAASTLTGAVTGSYAAVVSEFKYLDLYQTAKGGAGGYSDGGTAGAGGDAASTLTFDNTGAGHRYDSLKSGNLATGGAGGAANGASNGGDGGAASAISNLTALGYLFNALGHYGGVIKGTRAVGGVGGAAAGSGQGGAGGAAYASVNADSRSGAKDDVGAMADGGYGGASHAGDGGAGGAAGAVAATQSEFALGYAYAYGIAGAGGNGTGAGHTGGAGGLGGGSSASVRIGSLYGGSDNYQAKAKVYQAGGPGGGGAGGAAAGAGGSSALYNAAYAVCPKGVIYLSQTAVGGAGGSDGGSVPLSGAGGGAISNLAFDDSSQPIPASQTFATISAIGGVSIGAGGNASANATFNVANALTIKVVATGGLSYDSSTGAANAVLNASAGGALYTVTKAQDSVARPLGAGAYSSGAATAQSTTSGAGGTFFAKAIETFSNSQSLVTYMKVVGTGTVDGTQVSDAKADDAADAWTFHSTGQAVAELTTDPLSASTTAVLGANPNIATAFGASPSFFAIGELGASYAESGGSGSQTVISKFKFDVNLTNLASLQDLVVGFYNPVATGPAFSSLVFTLTGDGQTLVAQTFTTVAAAEAFFTDDAMDLGSLATGPLSGGTLLLKATFSLTTTSPGSGFYGQLIIGDPPPASHFAQLAAALGSTSAGAVPLPGLAHASVLPTLALTHAALA